MRHFAWAICLVAAATPGAAQEFVTAKEAASGARTDLGKIARIVGAGEALGWANVYIEEAGGRKLYCQPAQLGLTGGQYIAILETYIKAEPAMADVPVEFALIEALAYAFPC